MKPDRLRLAAIRAATINALRAARPDLRSGEIAVALKLKPGTVRFHMRGEVKCRPCTTPLWADDLASACRLLGTGNVQWAADAFEELARGLRG